MGWCVLQFWIFRLQFQIIASEQIVAICIAIGCKSYANYFISNKCKIYLFQSIETQIRWRLSSIRLNPDTLSLSTEKCADEE